MTTTRKETEAPMEVSAGKTVVFNDKLDLEERKTLEKMIILIRAAIETAISEGTLRGMRRADSLARLGNEEEERIKGIKGVD